MRAENIALSLWRSGIKDALEKAQMISGGHMLTRTHFAQMLIQEGYCKDMKSVFRRYLTGKKPGGVLELNGKILMKLSIGYNQLEVKPLLRIHFVIE